MNHPRQKTVSTLAVAGGILVAPSSASASAGSLFEGLVLPLVGIGVVFWIAFATIAPLRRVILRIPRNANGPVAFILGTAALAFAAVSILTGKTTIGAGIVVQAIEPLRFWQLIKLQIGAGCVLLVLGLLGRGRSK